jgi:hypothetical protein
VYETAAQSNVQRTLGDNHDLTSPRFAGEPILEACYDDQARLTKGATGPAVVKIQQALVDLGYNLGPSGVDGIYGTYTWNAVKQFKKNGNCSTRYEEGNGWGEGLFDSIEGGHTLTLSGVDDRTDGSE